MNDDMFNYALEKIDNMSAVEMFNYLKMHGIDVQWRIVPSRNQREGRYAGCFKGWHVRGGKQGYEFIATKGPSWGKCRHILGERHFK